MGLFDRIVDDHVLMALPELYKHSRLGEYFSLKLFGWYMLDGAYQVSHSLFKKLESSTDEIPVCHHFLLPPLWILLADVSQRRFRYLLIRILDRKSTFDLKLNLRTHHFAADNGHRCCYGLYIVRRHQRHYMDRLGLLLARHRDFPHLGLHCEHFPLSCSS